MILKHFKYQISLNLGSYLPHKSCSAAEFMGSTNSYNLILDKLASSEKVMVVEDVFYV